MLKTAVTDLEVESEEEDGFLWHIRYPLADGSGIADGGHHAARDHARRHRRDGAPGRRALHGTWSASTVRLPLCDRAIPVIADDYVDREFGTGVVKVTPAHDSNDYAVGQRHKLPMIGVLHARRDDQRQRARRRTAAWTASSRASRSSPTSTRRACWSRRKKHKLMVPRCARTGQVVEPMLTDQWFVAMTKAGGRRQVDRAEGHRRGRQRRRCASCPSNWVNTYNQWMNNIQDWCISRQLWWGHQIPAWYDEDGKVFVRATRPRRSAPGAAGYTAR